MNNIVLDFSGIKTLWYLHEYFKEVFQLPDYYGRNMDALWDCLHCSFTEPTTIILKNIEALPKDLNEAKEIMLALFRELEQRNEEVTVRIESGDDANNSSFLI